jgi:hypothetical protein
MFAFMEIVNTCIFQFEIGRKRPVVKGKRWQGDIINLLKPTGHVVHQTFNIQQLYALPTLYLCDLYLSENKQRLVPLIA